jgi:short-subunit dehydrogenase
LIANSKKSVKGWRRKLSRVVLITGASRGIGKACAERLVAEGDNVYGTSRHPEAENGDRNLHMLAMDVNRDESVNAAVNKILAVERRIDVVINNAGFGIAGSVEDTSVEEGKSLFETNFFGVLRVCRAVLPTMRNMGRGTILNISSLGGRIGLPYQGLYSATKFAIEGLSEALRMELRQFGIDVTLVEPGDVCTDFTDSRLYTTGSVGSSPYHRSMERTMTVVERDERGGSSPGQIADLVMRILAKPSPKVRYSAGGLSQRAAAVLKQITPSRFFERAIMRYYRVV